MMRAGNRTSRISSEQIAHVRVWILASLVGVLSCCALAFTTSAWAAPCSNATFLTGSSASLPDCRAYEQLSPTNKGGFAAYPTQATPAQVSASGSGLAYLNYAAFPGALGNTALFAAHLGSRTPSGWQNTELTPPVPKASVLKIDLVGYSFSEDLSQAILKVPLAPLTPEATPGVYNLFLRHSNGSFSLVNAAAPAQSAEQLCPPVLAAICFLIADVPAYAGASSDFGHILFESTGELTPEAPPPVEEVPVQSLYESTGGHVSLVGILPDGEPAQGSTAGAGSSAELISGEQTVDQRVEHAISQDGSRIFWTDPTTGDLYVREDNSQPNAKTVLIAEGGEFWTASNDGSVVFYTKAGDLYEYELETETEGKTKPARTTDLAPGGEVQGVIDASVDGSYVYFVADGELVPGKGVAGQPNLYMEHNGGAPVFIATLSSSGSCSFSSATSADSCDWTIFTPELEAYVTPNGQHLAFMSTMSIPTAKFPSGYDNVDQNTGLNDSEVYEYDAPSAEEEHSEETGRLTCASCDSEGIPPVGNALIGGITQTLEPTYTGSQPEPNPYNGISTPFYHVRSVSEDGGRVLYTAPALHANPYDRVYEFEQSGAGSCTSEGGCQYMISSPNLDAPDQFLGLSASGSDIFFATGTRLSAADRDNLSDIYDARVGGGFSTESQPTACEATCQQSVSPAAAPGLVGDVAGPSGNVPPVLTASAPPTRAQKLAKALHACRAKANKHKRATCEASARRRYGPIKRSHAKSSHNNRRAK